MISVIHPTSHFGPSAGAVGGSRVPAFPGFTGQTALMPSSHDQISDLYRRRGSGYTHHVSNSSWMTTSASIAASAGPTPASTSGAARGPAAYSQQQPPRAVSSRSLSSYSSVSTTGQRQPTTVVAPSRQTSSISTNSSEVGQIKPRGLMAPPPGKDFSKPLFVDCSIEYELPNAPKIPKNSLPILMIHPGFQQKKQRQQINQQIQLEQQLQQQQQQQQQKQQQQQLLMNIKNKDTTVVNSKQNSGCTAPNCHCRMKIVSNSMKPGTKRSYSNALGSNASTTTQAQFYKQQQQQQQQQLQQQQKNRQQHPPAPPAAHHAYFEAQAAAAAHANASSSAATSASAQASEAKRSRMMAVEQVQKQQREHQLLQYNHQQLLRAQMQAAAALRHYQQSFGYTRGGSAVNHPQAQPHPSVTSRAGATSNQAAGPQPISRPDMRISSFQQITPPESLAFWQQQQQLTTSSVCRSACCANAGPAAYTNCTPVRPAVCCYPTPIVTGNPTVGGAGFCIGCAQGKCQVNVNKENLGIMRSL